MKNLVLISIALSIPLLVLSVLGAVGCFEPGKWEKHVKDEFIRVDKICQRHFNQIYDSPKIERLDKFYARDTRGYYYKIDNKKVILCYEHLFTGLCVKVIAK